MALIEPITEDAARAQLRLGDADAPLLGGNITAAREWVENYTGHLLAEREVTEAVTLGDNVTLRAWPIASDAVPTVGYLDDSGAVVAIPARIDARARPARLLPVGTRWPAVPCGARITVTVTAGYRSTADVPASFQQAMLVLVTAYHEDREGGDMTERAEAAARGLCRWARWRRL